VADATSNGLLHCSFCKKGQAEVRKLIAGPSIFICDECVEVCVDILDSEPRPEESAADTRSRLEQRARVRAAEMNSAGPASAAQALDLPPWHVRCSLCHFIVITDDAFLVPNRGVLCKPCIAAVQAVYQNASDGQEA
jgi:hypothetical protein